MGSINRIIAGLCVVAVASSFGARPVSAVDLPAPATTDAAQAEADLRALEAGLGADAAAAPAAPPAAPSALGRIVQSMNPNMSVILDTALAAFSIDKPFQQGAHDPSQTGFNLQQMEMHLESSVDPFLQYQANIVFAQFGVEVEEAYAQTLQMPANFQVKAGQFLTAFGRLNPTHPHSWQFLDQPLAIGKFFGAEGNRGLGLEIGWLSPLPWYAEAKLSLTQATGECCARSYFGGQAVPTRSPLDTLATATLKQFFPIDGDWSLYWGLSAQTGPNSSGNRNRTEVAGTDVYLRWRPAADADRQAVSFHAEHLVRARQLPRRSLVDHAGFAQLAWQFALRWEVAARTEWATGLVEDPLDPLWNATRSRHAVQATFYPSHFARLRLQLAQDRPPWRPEPVYAVMLGLETLVGEHGAHNF